jgi:nucleotide-binding universal stress UspA family protein
VFERILVPLDGSGLADAILSQLRRILLYKDADVLLVRSVSLLPSVEADAVELPSILKAQAEKYLEEKASSLRAQGARVETFTRLGAAANGILDIAAEEKATVILMSTHGRSGLARWALGSVAEKVLRASRVPVLAVRSFAGAGSDAPRSGAEELSFKKILVPIDSSDLSLDVVPATLELAKLFGSHVVLLNVCDGLECTIPVPEMTAAYEQFRVGGISVEPLMKQGNPAAEILDTCSGQKADLIAMTTHGRAGISRWMLGSVTEKVLRASPVPMLVVRPAGVTMAQNNDPQKMHEART